MQVFRYACDPLVCIVETEIEELESDSKTDLVDINRLRLLTREEEKFIKVAIDQQQVNENELQNLYGILSSLDVEIEVFRKGILDLRIQGKTEMEALEKLVKEKKDEHSKLALQVSEHENILKRLKKDSDELETQLGKEREELGTLHKLNQENAAGADPILVERSELMQKVEQIDGKNLSVTNLINSVSNEITVSSEQYSVSKKLLSELETRLYGLCDQHTKLVQDSKSKIEQGQRLCKRLSTMESERSDIVTQIDVLEHRYTHEVEKELKHTQKMVNNQTSKLSSLKDEIAANASVVNKLETDFHQKRLNLRSVITQSDFMKHQVQALEEWISQARAETVRVHDQLSELASSDKPGILEKIKEENDVLSTEIQKIQTDIEFMASQGMLGDDGRTKPLLIQSESEDPNSLSERLNINGFLRDAQSEADVGKCILMMVEKMSQLLDMVHAAETLELQYGRDLARSTELARQLKEKNASAQHQVSTLEDYSSSSRFQFAKNLFASLGNVKLLLRGMEYRDEDIADLMNELSEAAKGRIEKIDVSRNNLVNLNLSKLVADCAILKFLDVRGNDLQTVNELDRFLRNKIDGVTSVFRDSYMLVANSGAQVRFTMLHGPSA